MRIHRAKGSDYCLGMSRAMVWMGETTRDAIAWSRSFHSDGLLLAKHRLETRTRASSVLGIPNPHSWKQRAASTARRSGGSPRSSAALTAAMTRHSKSEGKPPASTTSISLDAPFPIPSLSLSLSLQLVVVVKKGSRTSSACKGPATETTTGISL